MGTDRGEPMGQGPSDGRRSGRGRVKAAGTEPALLVLRVVEYPDAPDRCTVYPPGLEDGDRMTHWISADRDAFAALDAHR